MKEQALKFKQELRAQDLTCKLLKEKLTCKEAELEQRNDDVVALEQRRDWLEAEVLKLQRFLVEANQKISSLERQVCGSTTSSYLCPVILSHRCCCQEILHDSRVCILTTSIAQPA